MHLDDTEQFLCDIALLGDLGLLQRNPVGPRRHSDEFKLAGGIRDGRERERLLITGRIPRPESHVEPSRREHFLLSRKFDLSPDDAAHDDREIDLAELIRLRERGHVQIPRNPEGVVQRLGFQRHHILLIGESMLEAKSDPGRVSQILIAEEAGTPDAGFRDDFFARIAPTVGVGIDNRLNVQAAESDSRVEVVEEEMVRRGGISDGAGDTLRRPEAALPSGSDHRTEQAERKIVGDLDAGQRILRFERSLVEDVEPEFPRNALAEIDAEIPETPVGMAIPGGTAEQKARYAGILARRLL